MSSETAANPSILPLSHAMPIAESAVENYPERYKVPGVPVQLFSLAEAETLSPTLAGLRTCLSAYLQRATGNATSPICNGVIHPSNELQALIKDDTVGRLALVMLLPPEFELSLNEMVGCEPWGFNYHTIDLQNDVTYLKYSVRVPDERHRTELWMLAWAVRDAMNSCYPIRGFDDHIGRRLAVIMVSGNTVAAGGFFIHVDQLSVLSAAMMHANTVPREHIYSEDELTDAARLAQEVGQVPWTTGYWQPCESLLHDGTERITECVFYDLASAEG